MKLGTFSWIPTQKLQRNDGKTSEKFIHLIKLIIINKPEILNYVNEKTFEIPGINCYTSNPRYRYDKLAIQECAEKSTHLVPNHLIQIKNKVYNIKPTAHDYRIITGFSSLQITGKAMKPKIQTFEGAVKR